MFSAKKIDGKKLYELARRGIEIERKPVSVTMTTTLLSYAYPYLCLNVACSKGTYVRTIAHDLGNLLGCGAHLSELRRLRSGTFHVKDSINGVFLYDHR
jgi:tRNA pseudouridine55 synthase